MGRIILSVPMITAIAAVLTVQTALAGPAADPAAVRYEAEAATGNNTKTADLASASGGKYVKMEEGSLSFTVTAPSAGFYTVWISYSQTYDSNKKQNFVINGDLYGTPSGSIGFPQTGTIDGPPVFKPIKAIGKVNLKSGANTLAITRDWGWVDIDYIEVGPYVSEPFNLSGSLVTPNASENAKKMYQFLRENFQKKVISGVMTDNTMRTDQGNPPYTIKSQPEMAHIDSASGKLPALLGLDFMHGSGLKSDDMWFQGYTKAALALAEEMFNAGGIPIFCWHWKDPNRQTEDQAFYTKKTDFDPAKIFKDAACTLVDENSDEYKNVIRDIDTISGYLKQLADKNIAVLWRPLHEAAGGWFWWGRGNNPKPCNALWRLMFDRMVNRHKLNNLIWVWTCEESGDALEWYPGDAYVDIIGRDIYPPNNQQEKVHVSWVSNFEHLKDLYGARKIIALSENGAIPHPDSLKTDGAGWSWFMSWNREFVFQVNTGAMWNSVMNNSYVITLDEMPGWGKYNLTSICKMTPAASLAQSRVSIKSRRNSLELNVKGIDVRSVELFDLRGARVAVLSKDKLSDGKYIFSTNGLARQMCFVRVIGIDKKVTTLSVRID